MLVVIMSVTIRARVSNLFDRRAKYTNFKLVASCICNFTTNKTKYNKFFGGGCSGTKPEVELVLQEGGICRGQGEVYNSEKNL